MSEELSALIRAAARHETSVADQQFPYSLATVERLRGAVRRRRAAGAAMVGVGGMAVVGAGALGLGQLHLVLPPEPMTVPTEASTRSPSSSAAPSPTVATPSLTPSATPTPTPTPAPSPTGYPLPQETTGGPDPGTAPRSPAGTAPASPAATPPTAPPSPPPAVVAPGQVTVVDAYRGGGSGEIVVAWAAVADATGYVVYRSDAPDGPFVSAARVDVATGTTTVTFTGTFVHIVIWQPTAESFEYVEAGASSGTGAHFRVVALNAGGAGPASAVVCGAPPGDPDC